MTKIITTFFGIGLIPFAPGTWGSLAALPLGYLLHGLGGFPLLVVGIVLSFVIGLWATKRETMGKEDHDPSSIVIDEVCGQWIALSATSFGLWYMDFDPWLFPYPGWVSAFLLFRLFDIWKPWLVGKADRMHTPLGVMLDDVIAGIFAAIVTALLAVIAHGIMV